MSLRLHDSATREVRDFEPLTEGRVGVYVCGLTVQGEPHVGHVRSAVAFDVLRRWLLASGYAVDFVRNVTDIDDKILAKAAAAGMHWYELAYAMTRVLDGVYDDLNVLPPTYVPLATGHVPEMVELIGELVEKGHAYPAPDGSGDVYFDVRSWPEYGGLTGQRTEDMEAAADADPRGKRDPRDFALWKGRQPGSGEPESASWASPWGRGRPGWHIECSAMAGKYLGPAFDIHGGGVDLRFPHHENEQAQSRAAGRPFASYWLHNAWITTAGEKMSKSLGNSLLVPEVLRRVRGIELRYYMVGAHYRSTVEFSFEALDEAAAGFRRIEGFLARAVDVVGEVPAPGVACAEFVNAMDDDLGTPAAVGAVFDVVREGNKLLAGGDSPALRGVVASVRAMLDVLGVDPYDPAWGAARGGDDARAGRLTEAVDVLVRGLLEQRGEARTAKDFGTADAIRDRIAAAGVEVTDTPSGPAWSLARPDKD
ncbi:cysteine--tRNA ligase [Marmoricola endophyticus]|uniref:Cysteine--tRNA ligase n=1 Tax=Marmoricola endophyticus TaxID=2040280 RepID=A0A917F6B0_9ACTN|nr:cysteine--tRNA ligase [Marmoricola endophyticus]GGF52088.1 cysteine--tRNA ligase [Marmoricola endophyticus]